MDSRTRSITWSFPAIEFLFTDAQPLIAGVRNFPWLHMVTADRDTVRRVTGNCEKLGRISASVQLLAGVATPCNRQTNGRPWAP